MSAFFSSTHPTHHAMSERNLDQVILYFTDRRALAAPYAVNSSIHALLYHRTLNLAQSTRLLEAVTRFHTEIKPALTLTEKKHQLHKLSDAYLLCLKRDNDPNRALFGTLANHWLELNRPDLNNTIPNELYPPRAEELNILRVA